jgi:hypothetical protein
MLKLGQGIDILAQSAILLMIGRFVKWVLPTFLIDRGLCE